MVIDQLDPLNVEVHLPTAYLGVGYAGMKATGRPAEPIAGQNMAEVNCRRGV